MESPPTKKRGGDRVKRPTQHYPLVEVIWDDAAGLRHGWAAKHEQIIPQMALSVGFLIVDAPTHIIIAQDTDGEGSHNGRTQIPRGMVKKLKVLRKKDQPDADSEANAGGNAGGSRPS